LGILSPRLFPAQTETIVLADSSSESVYTEIKRMFKLAKS